jgi:L-lactate dehydrogenase complex protein LldF
MKISSKQFQQTARQTIETPKLQSAFHSSMLRLSTARDEAYAQLPDLQSMRQELKKIRQATIAHLAEYLAEFEGNARQAGAQVHWAKDKADVGRIVLEIARREQARRIVKSKSMVTEEVGLNHILESEGIQVVETDLGEYIIQLAGETPSHIIAPAVHKTTRQVAELFAEKLGQDLESDPEALTGFARQTLRRMFLEAEIGISGVNLGVAETGSIVLVTNEGNGRMVTSLPPVHIAVMGIERLAPTWEAAATWLSLLARSATGQPLSIYTSVITGPARPDELDGPRAVHIILLDNNRSALSGTKYQEVLECIRCGACLSVCPVYKDSGGHAYHSPYSGPIGAVISPLLFGLENYPGLPQASTLCGACLEVCPVQIDLPRMLHALRVDEVEQGLVPWPEAFSERLGSALMARPSWMDIFFRLGRLGQLLLRLFNIGLLGLERFPLLAKRSFRNLWHSQEAGNEPQE